MKIHQALYSQRVHFLIVLYASLKFKKEGNSLEVQWLGIHTSTAGGTGSIPGRGTKIPHAARRSQKQTKKKTQQQ